MGGLGRRLPAVFWPFLAGALCLAGVPPTGGFFSKDSILAVVWAQGGTFYTALYLVGMVTVFLTALYTFRMLFLVFGDRPAAVPAKGLPPAPLQQLPAVMTLVLIPLAFLGLAGGIFNLPAYLGNGLLQSFLAPLKSGGEHLAHRTELALQGAASLAALAGMAVAWWYYGRQRRAGRLALAEQPVSGITAFLRAGWYVDDLYRHLFIHPYHWLAAILWEKVDEGAIDDSLDRMAVQLGHSGQRLGRWGSGRISAYMLSLAGGATLILAWFAWGVL